MAGVPSVAVITERFVSAADLMASVLGATGYEFVTIAHPISSRSEAELAEEARRAALECARRLTTKR